MKKIYQEQYRQIGLKIAYYRRLRCMTQEELAGQVDRLRHLLDIWRHRI